MQNKTKLFKTAICIITTLILIFGTIPCGAVLSDESNAPTFTNLVVFMKFSDEDEFINNTYADTTVRNILDNTYNKSVYNVADYFKTVSGGKMNMQHTAYRRQRQMCIRDSFGTITHIQI